MDLSQRAAVFSGRHVLYFFERRRKLTGAVVSDLCGNLGNVPAFFTQQNFRRVIHAIIGEPRADGCAVRCLKAGLHRCQRKIESCRKLFLREVFGDMLGEKIAHGLGFFKLCLIKYGCAAFSFGGVMLSSEQQLSILI